jgi:hypothetical protein
MTEDLSYVGMANCFVCNKPKEILLHKQLKNKLPKSAVYDKVPCDECSGFMKQGIIFIGVRDGEQGKDNPYRTGEWFVLKEEAVRRMPMNKELMKSIIKKRICFIEQEVINKLGIAELIKKEKSVS